LSIIFLAFPKYCLNFCILPAASKRFSVRLSSMCESYTVMVAGVQNAIDVALLLAKQSLLGSLPLGRIPPVCVHL
jgi:hypothetical protein